MADAELFQKIEDGIIIIPPFGIPMKYSATDKIIELIERVHGVTCEKIENMRELEHGQDVYIWISQENDTKRGIQTINAYVLPPKIPWHLGVPKEHIFMHAILKGKMRKFTKI